MLGRGRCVGLCGLAHCVVGCHVGGDVFRCLRLRDVVCAYVIESKHRSKCRCGF